MDGEVCGELWVLNRNASDTSQLLLLLIILNIISFLLIVFLNSSAVIAIWRLEQIAGSTKEILLNLAITDLLSGLLSELLWIIFMGTQLAGYQNCILAKATTFCGLVLWTVSFSTLVLASIERYMCIFRPFSHNAVNTSKRFSAIIACIWVTGILLSILYQFQVMKETLLIMGAVVNSIGCSVIGFVYVRVCHFAYKVRKEIKAQAQSVHNESREAQPIRRRGSFNMVALIVGLSILFYFPYGVSLYITTLSSTKVDARTFSFLWTLTLSNALIDPICYFLLNKTLRHKILDLWKNILKMETASLERPISLRDTERT